MNNTEQQFEDLIVQVLAFYKQEVSPFALAVWWEACKRFEHAQVSRALTNHALDPERGAYPPKPADLVRQIEGTQTDRAMMAWGKVYEAMKSVGAYSDVVFDDPAIHATVEDMGGWPKLCRTEMSELGYVQHRFTQTHKAYTEQKQFTYPRRLIGERSADHEFTSRGLSVPKPAVIGNIEKARQVYRAGSATGKTAIVYDFMAATQKALGA